MGSCIFGAKTVIGERVVIQLLYRRQLRQWSDSRGRQLRWEPSGDSVTERCGCGASGAVHAVIGENAAWLLKTSWCSFELRREPLLPGTTRSCRRRFRIPGELRSCWDRRKTLPMKPDLKSGLHARPNRWSIAHLKSPSYHRLAGTNVTDPGWPTVGVAGKGVPVIGVLATPSRRRSIGGRIDLPTGAVIQRQI